MFKKLLSFLSNKDPKELLQLATQKKKEGNLDEAIQYLKDAYKQIGKSNIDYGVKPFLRLPKYLRLAKRNDEAWSEFNKLLSKGYPNQSNDIGIIHMDHSAIYDSMRLFLQRENKNKDALIYFSLSYLKQIQGLSVQKRKAEIKPLRTKKYLKERLTPHVKKADSENEIDKFIEILINETATLNKIDAGRATRKIKSIL